MRRKWLMITIIAVAVILVLTSIPTGIILKVNNSTYDCSFQYSKYDNLVNEIARKHTYYNAKDKTVEVQLDQDMINSLIKDNLASMKLDLPEKFTLNEVLFNTKDQRIYINGKYGNINTPISAKLNVKFVDAGFQVTADDLKVGTMNAPGFVKKQIPAEALSFSFSYKDLNVPQVFNVKDVKFGSGTVTLTIQLVPDKVATYAAEYRNTILKEIDSFKAGQPETVGIFLNKLLGTGILSEAKVKEYVEFALNDEELVNSARFYGTAGNLSRYTDIVTGVQKKVTDWAAPLQNVKYYGSIDETVTKLTEDQKLMELLGWFVPGDKINEYKATVNDYYGQYKYYMAMLDDAQNTLNKTVNGIPTKEIDQYVNLVLDYAKQFEDAREILNGKVAMVDDKVITDVINQLEPDKDIAADSIAIAKDVRDIAADFLNRTYTAEVDEFSSALKDQRNYTFEVIRMLRNNELEKAANTLTKSGVMSYKTKTYVDKYSKMADMGEVNSFLEENRNPR